MELKRTETVTHKNEVVVEFDEVRLPQSVYLEINRKAFAEGQSVNEYVGAIVKTTTLVRHAEFYLRGKHVATVRV